MYEDCVKALAFGHDVCLLGNEEVRGSRVGGLQCLIILRGRDFTPHAALVAVSCKPFAESLSLPLLPRHFSKDTTRKPNVMKQEQSIFLGKAEQRTSGLVYTKEIKEDVNAK